MAQNVISGAVPCVDATIVLTGSPQVALNARSDRSGLMIQAPSGSPLTFSFTNPLCAPGLAGCFTIAYTNGPFIFTGLLPSNPLYVNGTAAAIVPIMVAGG